MQNFNENNLVWIDLEMTGLDCERERIIEMAAVITNSNLDVLAESPVFAIHQPQSLLDGMDGWNIKHHTQSGLVRRVQMSVVTESQAEASMLAFLKEFVPPQKSPMCGNSIWQDRRFLAKYMPQLEKFFHYRLLDVSTLKIITQRWYPSLQGFKKESTHQALQDVRDSIEELRYYRTHLLK
ncbi:MAG: hypothetical protein ACD_42C00153G0002 [uncultured bacterium]|nr:MAG: hypothetical protein ACD_42C00153G0002 [uncultured bacterium]OGT25141.1 MAG: oligoribonuclease [Gammaproteobacteria bacterium RIFCSPHIGHO2_02_FULL_42_43]OGT27952.1 MAG: oligoribonuclease [Gammaproteobacteria bacterium RIFCSPHIGHO2_01_FULL_42_8]OGT50964.1 MAG: oligoribonuclease [Gammaproteobacteria bacterium RIFCSPHIGHO2_12_FULL_41_25]OGT63062.1 MAG: oligoribonuclease [Gammaproteobacteria bacterium RIFCSPLOWO2_02_FULL_42_14]OGT85645.1 MAG: oligoribonuclease [Gammaproteobacteria bacteriu